MLYYLGNSNVFDLAKIVRTLYEQTDALRTPGHCGGRADDGTSAVPIQGAPLFADARV